jgi:hypothetical protein
MARRLAPRRAAGPHRAGPLPPRGGGRRTAGEAPSGTPGGQGRWGQPSLAWVLRPEVSSAIIGASRPEQVEENVRASGVILDAEALARIDAALRPR